VEATASTDKVVGEPCGPGTGVNVYALTSVSTTVSSANINMALYTGAYVSVTGPAVLVDVYWGMTPTAYTKAFTLKGNQTICLPRQGNWLKFVSVSTLTYTATSLYYDPILATTSGASGAGTVTWGSGLGLSITAQPSMDPLSETTEGWVTFTATSKNITTAAGSTGNCYYCVHPSYGGSQIRVRFTKSATAPSDIYSVGNAVATSATAAQCWGPFVPGTIVHVIGAGAASVTGTATFGVMR
jgi:hypothetical protein